MSAKDTFHNQVRDALRHDGWTITHDPFPIKIGRRKAFIDMAAEMPLAAEKEGRKIAVEVKSFLGQSPLDDLEDALGQFGIYRAMLELREPDRSLYLAVPLTTRELLLEERDFRYILTRFQTNLLIFDPLGKEPLEWIEQTSIA